MSTEDHWVLIVLALISSFGAIGAAWAANASRSNTKRLDANNTTQHAGTAGQLAQVAKRQDWMVTQLGEIRQALLDHVTWEEKSKYNDLEQHLAAIERTMKEKS